MLHSFWFLKDDPPRFIRHEDRGQVQIVAPGCIGLCDPLVSEALSSGKRAVSDKRGRGRSMTSAEDRHCGLGSS
jgi:hypothetical protein